MNNNLKKRLLDARDACRAIETFLAGQTFDDYQADLLRRSAVERQFEIVGEALNQAQTVDAGLEQRLPEVRRIVGLRNRIIHGYDSVDDELVWQIAQTHLPSLARQLDVLLAE